MQTLQVVSLTWNSLWNIAALTGGISAVLAAVGTWLLMRFTKPLDSYTQEVAKQLARHQNLDKLVDETRRLTDVAEKIKSELAQENWDRQTRFVAKRDLYVSTAEALADLRRLSMRIRTLERLRLRGVNDPRMDLTKALHEANERWGRVNAVAPLMMSDEAYKALRELTLRPVQYGTPEWEDVIDRNIADMERALYQFQLAARADLGFALMTWKPSLLTTVPEEEDLQ
jgi:hypothetical protein